ncbi:MAG: DNA repair protein RecO [Candidatus Vogelbacteria bacterium]|nr:DNA repair protein RecO [Candidatus Vogelbacteria bacterium]
MYTIYTTEGWVLSGVNVGENNRYLDLFTQDLGLIRGVAQSVRKLESKLRYGLQDLSYSKLSLVRGREVWRIVNVEKLSVYDQVLKNKNKVELVSRVFSLLKRLVRGEEQDIALFNDVNLALDLTKKGDLTEEELKNLETALVYRILHKLGYIPDSVYLKHVSSFSDWNIQILKIDTFGRSAIIRQINDSLLHSHL